MNSKQVEGIYRLSPTQHGIFFHSKLQQNGDVFFGQIVGVLEGSLEVKALLSAWRKIVARHSILRTLFTTDSTGKPVQVVLKHVKLEIDQCDWTTLSDAERGRRLELFLAED